MCSKVALNTKLLKCIVSVPRRYSNTLSKQVIERHRKSKLSHDRETVETHQPELQAPRDYKYVYPEFLPNPNWHHRDRIREKLERADMLQRRSVIEIPEFYVGSILAVVASDKHAPGKTNRFVGICIDRDGVGLRAHFTLRNVVDNQGIEILYEMYNPTIQQISVLKLEQRLDDRLFYLRDAPAVYSTVPFDMEPVMLPPGVNVPVNTVKVKLGPRPWHERWERQELRGVAPLDLPQKFFDRAAQVAKPWLKHDLMLEYRGKIQDEEADNIMTEVHGSLRESAEKHRRVRRIKGGT